MELFLSALGILFFGALLSFGLGRKTLAGRWGSAVCIFGSALGFASALSFLVAGESASFIGAWTLPVGRFGLLLDPLACLFLLPVFLLGGVAALYGWSSLQESAQDRNLGAHWGFFNLTVFGLALSMTADNVFLFVLAWEVMSIAPFFCITLRDEQEDVRLAGRDYLVAAHIGVAFLLAMLLLFAGRAGSLEFMVMGQTVLSGRDSLIIFVLALIGFGCKAGIMPVHVWLPKAHPAAPSHVSAFLSGALIKAGLYGLLRIMTLLGEVPVWQASTLILFGLGTAFLGILFAMARQDLKTMLAYSSVENIGIILLGIGVGYAGLAHDLPGLSLLGFAGAFLHLLNHSLIKGLLFLCAGAVLHGAGTTVLARLGGLVTSMPKTAWLFGFGAVAVTGLPPFNGFLGELLIYLGAGHIAFQLDFAPASALWLAVAGLALVGGLAAAAMSKAFGLAFLGVARSTDGNTARDPGRFEMAAMLILAGCCLAMIFGAPFVFRLILPVVALFSGPLDPATTAMGGTALAFFAGAAAGLLAIISLLTVFRNRLLTRHGVRLSGTWDCGYAAPTARMQYSGGSYAEPLTTLLHPVSGVPGQNKQLADFFPRQAELVVPARDWLDTAVIRPAFRALAMLCQRLHVLQHGKTHLYILSVIGALIVLLILRVG